MIRKLVFSDVFAAMSGIEAVNNTDADKATEYGFSPVKTGENVILQSNNKGKGYSIAAMKITAKTAQKLSFSYKVSTEPTYDKFLILLNGTEEINKSGKIDWTGYNIKLSANDSVVLKYTKDSSGDRNDDTVYLKDFSAEKLYKLTFAGAPAGTTFVVKQGETVIEAEADGSYLLTNGNYTYTASAFGYGDANGSITVNDGDVSETVSMNKTAAYTVTFNITKPLGITAEAAVAVKSGNTIIAAEDGKYNLPADTYSYTITCEGCETETGEFTVGAEAMTVEVTLEKTLTFGDFFTELNGRADITNDTQNAFKPVKEGAVKYLQSSNKINGTESKITFTFTKPTRMSFDYMVSELGNTSTDSNYGLKIFRNEKLLDRYQEISTEWTSYEVFADAGDEITIAYSCYKNYSGEYIDDENLIKLKNFKAEHLTKISFNITPENAKVSISLGAQNVETINGKFLLEKGSYTYSVKAFGYKDIQRESLPVDGDMSKVDTTVWGKVPKQQSTVYAFDNTAGARKIQDVGFNGLSSEEELQFPTYQEFLQKLTPKINAQTLAKWQDDPLSVLNNPSGDKFHHFRGSDFDEKGLTVLERYKRYNGTEGNSDESSERYNTSARTTPDVEDLNQDNTLNENEKYFEYKVSLRPKDMQVGSNYIVNELSTSVPLANGTKGDIKWYQFKIPVKQYQRKVGAIQDFKTIRFMRMYMTNFKDSTFLRFGTFELVRGEWRVYERSLANSTAAPAAKGSLDVSTVNIEENASRTPVNYLLPPGVTRMRDPSQPQVRKENEQALSLKVTDLASQDALAVYKTTSYDLRQYKRLQLFTHAEALINDVTDLRNGDLSVFLRLGSDYKNNYYEYEIPLRLTPAGNYINPVDVWPTQNMMDFSLESFTNLKLHRNRAKRQGTNGVTYQTIYAETDPDNSLNTIRIVGNPSLAEVKVIMIGVRNTSSTGMVKSGEVWVNELRLTDFNESGGWAANASMNVALSDLGTVNVAGRVETY